MAHYTTSTNSAFSASYDFRTLTNGDIPQFIPGDPRVALVDESGRQLLVLTAAMAGEGVGTYKASIPVPDIPLAERVFYSVVWTGRTTSGSSLTATEPVLIEPNASLDYDDIIVLGAENELEFNIPVLPDDRTLRFDLYSANSLVLSIVPEGQQPTLPMFPTTPHNALSTSAQQAQDYYAEKLRRTNGSLPQASDAYVPAGRDASPPAISVRSYDMASIVSLTLPATDTLPPSLEAYTVILGYKVGKRKQQMTTQCWSITPTLLQQCTQLEQMLNKVRLEGAIETLRWKQSDLLLYLSRGLARFNAFGTVLTDFSGLQMQGTVQYWHTQCALYEALLAQMKGEGDMNFSLSNQQVTLETDRVAALESMLSRVEGQISNELPAVKKQLASYGVTGGDGSSGSSKFHPSHAGQAKLSLSHGQMTQVNRPRPWWWSYGFYW